MSRLCPSDVYKVYKRGSNVRIDTTLLGFDHTTWQRGDRSYIFKGQSKPFDRPHAIRAINWYKISILSFHWFGEAADCATMIEIDHEARAVSVEQLRGIVGDINGISPPRESVMARLSAPVTSNRIDMDKISFERNRSGIWGWRSDKMESINGYECKVYAASNVEFVTRSRNEHLNAEQARVSIHLICAVIRYQFQHCIFRILIHFVSKRARERHFKVS